MHSSHYYSSYKIQSAPPLAGHLSDLTIAEKYYLARIYSQCGEQKFTIDACVGMFGLSRHQTTVYLEGFCERGITKRHRNDMNRSYSYFLLITPDSHPECFSTAEIKSKKRQRTYPSVGVHIIGSINGKLPLYDALAIIANHFSFPDFSTRELYFFFCIALVIGVDSTPAAIPIIQTYFQFVSSPKRTISAAETSQYRI